MKVLLYDFRWTDEQSCEFQANSGNRFGRKSVKIGDKISIEVKSREKKCAGSIENGVWKTCPKNSIGKSKCDYCRSIEGNFIYTAFDGFDQSQLDAGDLAKISDSHFIYLAFFAENLIKVGVSKNSRKNLRQIEQGSLATLFVAETPDGIAARQIETILRQSGLADKAQVSQKKKVITLDIPTKEVEKILREKFSTHSKLFDQHEHLKDFFSASPEFISWENVYNLNKIKKSSKNFHSVSLRNEEWVSGVIVAMRGPFVIVETTDEQVCICAKELLGLEIDFETKETGLETKAVLQRSLF